MPVFRPLFKTDSSFAHIFAYGVQVCADAAKAAFCRICPNIFRLHSERRTLYCIEGYFITKSINTYFRQRRTIFMRYCLYLSPQCTLFINSIAAAHF